MNITDYMLGALLVLGGFVAVVGFFWSRNSGGDHE